jgi:hypothetical protein
VTSVLGAGLSIFSPAKECSLNSYFKKERESKNKAKREHTGKGEEGGGQGRKGIHWERNETSGPTAYRLL